MLLKCDRDVQGPCLAAGLRRPIRQFAVVSMNRLNYGGHRGHIESSGLVMLGAATRQLQLGPQRSPLDDWYAQQIP